MEIADPMIEIFTFETNQQLTQLEEMLIEVEEKGAFAHDEIDEVFRIMHTIKGSSAMMDFTAISGLAHAAEDLFNVIRNEKEVQVDHLKVADLVLKSADFFRNEIHKIQNGQTCDGKNGQIIEEIKEYLNQLSNSETVNTFQLHVWFDPEAKMEHVRAYGLINKLKKISSEIITLPENLEDESSSESIGRQGLEIYMVSSSHQKEIETILEKTLFLSNYEFKIDAPVDALEHYTIRIVFEKDAKMEGVRAFGLVNSLQKTCEGITHTPRDLEGEEQNRWIVENGLFLELDTRLSRVDLESLIKKTLFVEQVEFSVEIPQFSMKKENEPRKRQSEESYKNVNQSVISVNILKLDKVMDLIGEISVMQSVIINRKEAINTHSDEIYNNVTRQLTKLTNELRDTVMSIRLLPVSIIFNNVKRIVRDMKRQLDKEVVFEVYGEDTVLDKKIIDNLFDPLIHIVRNAMDHGIESAEERIQMGKEPVGSLKIKAESSGGYVVIEVIDDGKGIDKDKVLEKAIRLDALPKAKELLSEHEILNLIFESGLSTKKDVSSFSGRGVGMDIVKTKVEEMSGNIFVSSVVGVGTTFTIKVPLTLAILEGVKIQLGDSHFIIPSKMIEKTFRVEDEEVITDHNQVDLIKQDDQIYPIVKLSDFLGTQSSKTNYSDGIMVLVKENNESVGLFVDGITGEIESIIKPLPKYLLKYGVKENGISGCTKLENGDLCLILDVSRIISSVV